MSTHAPPAAVTLFFAPASCPAAVAWEGLRLATKCKKQLRRLTANAMLGDALGLAPEFVSKGL